MGKQYKCTRYSSLNHVFTRRTSFYYPDHALTKYTLNVENIFCLEKVYFLTLLKNAEPRAKRMLQTSTINWFVLIVSSIFVKLVGFRAVTPYLKVGLYNFKRGTSLSNPNQTKNIHFNWNLFYKKLVLCGR